MSADRYEAQSRRRGDDVKIPERTGKWIEMEQSTDMKGEITLQVPNGVWAGWLSPIFVKEEDLATCLRSLGWRVRLPQTVERMNSMQ